MLYFFFTTFIYHQFENIKSLCTRYFHPTLPIVWKFTYWSHSHSKVYHNLDDRHKRLKIYLIKFLNNFLKRMTTLITTFFTSYQCLIPSKKYNRLLRHIRAKSTIVNVTYPSSTQYHKCFRKCDKKKPLYSCFSTKCHSRVSSYTNR